MMTKNSSTKRNSLREHGQAMVEFAIALPILMLILVGIFEVGRMVFIYSAVYNASREAVRYASAYGQSDSGVEKYKDCASIRDWAKRSAYFLNLSDTNIEIQYLHPQKDGSGNDVLVGGALSQTVTYTTCSNSVTVSSGDRVQVKVTATYRPMLTLIPLRTRTFSSVSSRTILGVLRLSN